ncbi:MAG: glutaredoxin family protein [Aquabacterium sp.]|nr:glutaredoxin family protein [Aquabacterium sp.]
MRRTASTMAILAALTMAIGSPAWALYKVVGPDGRVTYSDRIPGDAPAQAIKPNGSVASTDGLPYELQRVAARYPVTLYTGSNCTPCDTGRQLLKARGIPFAESTVLTAEDVKALAKQDGTDQLPALRVGQKMIKGFSQTEWISYIDAAGYPAKSVLPLNYRWPAAKPLAPTDAKASDQTASTPARQHKPVDEGPTSTPTDSTPPRFRF